MKATNWEFANRALVFGLIFAFTFPLYALDHQNAVTTLANWLAPRLQMDAEVVARILFALAALLLLTAALVRTWASSYLHAGVVYAEEVKTTSLVAEGPYRYVRNPLYFANVLMAIGMGGLMSWTGFFLAGLAMLVFCYQLILGEEEGLQASQGEQYQTYLRAVPRLYPSLRPRVAAGGGKARWTEGFKAESWYWGFAAAVVAFALTLNTIAFFAILGASLVLFWILSRVLQTTARSQPAGSRESSPKGPDAPQNTN